MHLAQATGSGGMTTACTTASHEALKHSPAWITLPLIGLQVIEAYGEEPEERYQLRNCSCGSTLCKRVELSAA